MQLYPLLLIGVLLAWDGGMGLTADTLGLRGWVVAAIAWVPVLGVLAITCGGVRWYGGRLAHGHAPGALLAAERLVRYARWLLLAHHAVAVLVFGWLGTVRAAVGDSVLLDELLAITPPLIGLLGTWWVYYPIERRVREAVLVRRLDLGWAIFPPPTRGRYVLTQARLHLLLLLVPLLMIIALAELIDLVVAAGDEQTWPGWVGDAATFVGAMGIVILAPLLSRVLLDVEPMPKGPLRDDLLEICRIHGVKVRRLLMWKTHGSMINAAVMGLIGRLRYVLLTDALLESMTRDQVQAVMAHEIGHIRRHHMPWLVASLLATIAVTFLLVEAPFQVVATMVSTEPLPPWVGLAATVSALVLAMAVFGWISRRFERQADTFAVRHLSRPVSPAGNPQPPRATAEAVRIVCSALETIARLNALLPRRPSWRHGSIAWRQECLKSIVGRPLSTLPIDRQVRWIKALTTAVLSIVLTYAIVQAAQRVPDASGGASIPPVVLDDARVGWDDLDQRAGMLGESSRSG